MPDYIRTLGTAGRDFATPTALQANVAAITGSTNMVATQSRIFVDTWADSPIVDNFIADGITQDDTYKIIFRRAQGSARPTFTSASGMTVWVRDKFVSFHDIDINSTSGSTGDACIRLGNSGVLPEGNQFINVATNTTSALAVRVNNDSIGSASYPITFINPVMNKTVSSGNLIQLQNIFSGIPVNWYLRMVNGSLTGSEAIFAYRQDSASSLYRLELLNTECFGYFGSNAWITTGATAGTLDTSGSGFNYSKNAADILPGLGVPNPVTLTSIPSPGPGNWFIVQNATGFADMRPIDSSENDMLAAGVGPSANSLVPLFDFDRNKRKGATTTVGPFELPSQSASPLMMAHAF